jgi:hypothetical protein
VSDFDLLAERAARAALLQERGLLLQEIRELRETIRTLRFTSWASLAALSWLLVYILWRAFA